MQPSLPLSPDVNSHDKVTQFVLDYPEAELVFGVVYAIGTDYRPILDYLTDNIKPVSYTHLTLPTIYSV